MPKLTLRENFVRAQSDNLPEVNVMMVLDYFQHHDCFNIVESAGIKMER